LVEQLNFLSYFLSLFLAVRCAAVKTNFVREAAQFLVTFHSLFSVCLPPSSLFFPPSSFGLEGSIRAAYVFPERKSKEKLHKKKKKINFSLTNIFIFHFFK